MLEVLGEIDCRHAAFAEAAFYAVAIGEVISGMEPSYDSHGWLASVCRVLAGHL